MRMPRRASSRSRAVNTAIPTSTPTGTVQAKLPNEGATASATARKLFTAPITPIATTRPTTAPAAARSDRPSAPIPCVLVDDEPLGSATAAVIAAPPARTRQGTPRSRRAVPGRRRDAPPVQARPRHPALDRAAPSCEYRSTAGVDRKNRSSHRGQRHRPHTSAPTTTMAPATAVPATTAVASGTPATVDTRTNRRLHLRPDVPFTISLPRIGSGRRRAARDLPRQPTHSFTTDQQYHCGLPQNR